MIQNNWQKTRCRKHFYVPECQHEILSEEYFTIVFKKEVENILKGRDF